MENKFAILFCAFLLVAILFSVIVIKDVTEKNEEFYNKPSIIIEKTKSLNP